MKSLRIKIIITLLAGFILYGAAEQIIQRVLIIPSILKLERDEAAKDINRIVQSMQREIFHLSSLCHDWSAWDDTYEFVETRSQEYITANLVPTTFSVNHINFLYILDTAGRVVWGQARLFDNDTLLHVPEFEVAAIPLSHPLLAGDKRLPFTQQQVSGILNTSAGPMLVSARPVLKTNDQGPSRGWIIFGRLFNSAMIDSLSEQTQVAFDATRVSADITPQQKRLLELISAGPSPVIEEQSPEHLRCSVIFPGISGGPALLLSATVPRKISAEGFGTLREVARMQAGACVLFLLLVIWFLQRTVLEPINRLTQHTLAVRETGNLSSRLLLRRSDEIGHLSESFNLLVEQLESTMGQLQESERLYRGLTENSLACIALLEHNSIKYANRRTLELTGYGLEELQDLGVQLAHPDDRQMVLEKIALRSTKSSPRDHYEFRIITRSGAVRWIEVLVTLLDYKGSTVSLVHGIDITEKKEADAKHLQLEARLHKAEKMEAMGTLAGGIAHDLNNILCGIVTYPDLLLMNIQDRGQRSIIETIKESGEKAAAIVQDLLTLGRRGVIISDVVDLNAVIGYYLKSPEYDRLMTFHPNVTVETSLEENLLHVNGSAIHLSKTLMNLVSNAAEAIRAEGTIRIETFNYSVEREGDGFVESKPGDYVALRVSDTGCGISEQDLERIFEPFFTKKVMGRSGTGLGMSVVWTTVKDHNGSIDLHSEKDGGTTFTIYLPATRDMLPAAAAEITIDQIRGDGEHILIVDDVKIQRSVARELLTQLGYRVSLAESGEEAVEYIRTNPVDLVLLDMIMDPGIDGLETYRRIVQLRPGQKTIIVSGYAETERVREVLRLGAGRYVKKPYSIDKIGIALKQELLK